MIDYEKTSFATEACVDLDAVTMRSLKVRRAIEDLAFTGKGRLLDFGSGEGALPRTLKRLYPDAQVYGCDVSERMIAHARELSDDIQYDLCKNGLPYPDNHFDGVFLLDVLEHVPDPKATLAEVARVLRPGGRLLLHCPCEAQPCTLHWLCRIVGVGDDLSRKVGGHVQQLTHADVRRLARHAGLRCRRLRYAYHSTGQVFALVTFWRRWCQHLTEEDRADGVARLVARLPWWKINPVLNRASAMESRLLEHWPMGMGIDGCFEKLPRPRTVNPARF